MELWIFATVIDPGCLGMIVVPEYQTFHDTIHPILMRFWPEGQWRLRWDQSKPKLIIKHPRGTTEVLIRSGKNSATVEGINGPTIAFAWIEECGRIPLGAKAWEYVLGRLRQPAPLRSIWFSGSPRPGYMLDVFGIEDETMPEAALGRGGFEITPNYWIRRAYSSDNHYNPPDYVENLIRAYGEDFARQELFAELVMSHGRIFPGFKASIHVVPEFVAERLFRGAPQGQRAIGADFGWSKAPPAAMVGGLARGEVTAVVDEYYEHGADHKRQGAWIQRKQLERQVTGGVFCDRTGRAEMLTWRDGYEWAGGRVPSLGDVMEALIDWLPRCNLIRSALDLRGVGRFDHPAHPPGNKLGRPGLLISDECVNLVKEIKGYREPPLRAGQLRQEKGVGADHLIDACGYLLHGLGTDGGYHSARR